jgi:hypothetical protein
MGHAEYVSYQENKVDKPELLFSTVFATKSCCLKLSSIMIDAVPVTTPERKLTDPHLS